MKFFYYAIGLVLSLIPTAFLAWTLPHWPERWEDETSQADMLLKVGGTDDAIPHLERAVELHPGPVQWTNLGSVLADAGKTAQATTLFEQAAAASPEDADIHFYLGQLYQHDGKNDGAVVQFQAVLQLAPGRKDAHWNLGEVLLIMGKSDAGLEQFRIAEQQNPNDADAHFRLANVLYKLDRLPEAITEFEAALRLAPDNETARRALTEAQQIRAERAVAHPALPVTASPVKGPAQKKKKDN